MEPITLQSWGKSADPCSTKVLECLEDWIDLHRWSTSAPDKLVRLTAIIWIRMAAAAPASAAKEASWRRTAGTSRSEDSVGSWGHASKLRLLLLFIICIHYCKPLPVRECLLAVLKFKMAFPINFFSTKFLMLLMLIDYVLLRVSGLTKALYLINRTHPVQASGKLVL